MDHGLSYLFENYPWCILPGYLDRIILWYPEDGNIIEIGAMIDTIVRKFHIPTWMIAAKAAKYGIDYLFRRYVPYNGDRDWTYIRLASEGKHMKILRSLAFIRLRSRKLIKEFGKHYGYHLRDVISLRSGDNFPG